MMHDNEEDLIATESPLLGAIAGLVVGIIVALSFWVPVWLSVEAL